LPIKNDGCDIVGKGNNLKEEKADVQLNSVMQVVV
jgi:hypothetical protein